jgi:hypothetical protein
MGAGKHGAGLDTICIGQAPATGLGMLDVECLPVHDAVCSPGHHECAMQDTS